MTNRTENTMEVKKNELGYYVAVLHYKSGVSAVVSNAFDCEGNAQAVGERMLEAANRVDAEKERFANAYH